MLKEGMDGASTERSVRRVAVIGQGYVGLPLALLFVQKGFYVYGIDADRRKIEALVRGESYLPDVAASDLKACAETGRFQPTTRYDTIRRADAVVICVPTPLTAEHTPDLQYLEAAARGIGEYLRPGQVVILESSTFPGTTREVLQPMLESASGMTAGADFHIGYSPERIDPGNRDFTVSQIPKVVSGLTEACLKRAGDFYGRVFDAVVPVSSPEVAELTKLLENSHRLINIAFMNEVAVLCDEMNIDVWEVIEAAKTKPFGFTAFYPGPGIGGHCIPVDPLYLQWKTERLGRTSQFIRISDEINRYIPAYVADRVERLIGARGAARRPKALLYGVAYKKDINDVRESPALDLVRELMRKEMEVEYHDPYIPDIEVEGRKLHSVELTPERLREADCVVIFTDHTAMPLHDIVEHARLVFDTRNATFRIRAPHVHRLGAGAREA